MNDAIKRKIKESRIMQYEIAAKIGISEYTNGRRRCRHGMGCYASI